MEYLKLTFEYIKHNKLKTFLCALIPAIVFAFVYNPATLLNFFVLYHNKEFSSFLEIYSMMNNICGARSVILYILAIIIGAIFLGVLLGSAQRRMRYGVEYRNTTKTFWNKVNSFFIPVLLVELTYSLVVQVFILLFSIIAFLFVKISSDILSLTLLLVLMVILCALLLFASALFITTLPNMTIRGWGFFKAMRVSASECIGKIFKIMLSIFLPVFVVLIPTLLVNIFDFPGDVFVDYLFSLIFYIFLFGIGGPNIYTIFFEVNEMDREDLKNYKAWGLK